MKNLYGVDRIALKKKMVECELETLTALSKASEVDRNTLSKVMNGESKPSTATIERLMLALKLEPQEAGTIFFNQKLT